MLEKSDKAESQPVTANTSTEAKTTNTKTETVMADTATEPAVTTDEKK